MRDPIARELDGRVGVVQVVAVVDVVEIHGRFGEDVESGGVGFAKSLRSVQGIDEDRGPAYDAVTQAMKDLKPRRMLEVSIGYPKINRLSAQW